MRKSTELQITDDPDRDLTIVERLSIQTAYGAGWEDDLDFVILAPQNMSLKMFNRDATITEVPVLVPGGWCDGQMTDAANGSSWSCSVCEWTDDHGPAPHRFKFSPKSLYLFHHA